MSPVDPRPRPPASAGRVQFSPNILPAYLRRTDAIEEWMQRDLSGKQYVYVWADGIHVKIRLEDDAGTEQCILALMRATADGKKEPTLRSGSSSQPTDSGMSISVSCDLVAASDRSNPVAKNVDLIQRTIGAIRG